MPKTQPEPFLISLQDAAARISVSTDTIREMVKDGQLESVLLRQRILRIPLTSVLQLARPERHGNAKVGNR